MLQKISLFLFLAFISLDNALAATGLPWESPLEKILASLTGPVAKILGVIAITIAGFGIAFGEAGSGMRRLFQVVLGLSIAFTASSLIVSLFGFTGGGA
jgi:type IV secretion system protein TrbC